MMKVIAFNWAFKVSVEIVFKPLTYAIVGWLKRREHEDWYDRHTDFTPFFLEGLSHRRAGRQRDAVALKTHHE
jgi:hypothetical protein